MGTGKAIGTIYAEREKFIIIGLTGRTGSGCTTVSGILEAERFEDLHLHEPKTTDFDKNEQRKYQIIYNYAKQHWNAFCRISMTDIIFSFILQKSYDDFMTELEAIIGDDLVTSIKNSISKKYPELESEFAYLNDKISRVFNVDDGLDRTDSNKLKDAYNILIRLPSLQTKFREIMNYINYYDEEKKLAVNTFTFCLQEFGNRIRHHGDVSNNQSFSGIHMFALARRANDFIKAVEYNNNKENKLPTFICLDAIRNPYEATYFQDRYSSFFLVAVSTDNDERIRRLGETLNHEQIKALDDKEYPSKLGGEFKFTNQDIGACMQLADIYLYNPHETTEEKNFITESVVKYVTLMKHPGLITPSSVERCMQIAYNAKLNSGCLSRQVGAVITDSNYSISRLLVGIALLKDKFLAI